MSAITQGRQDLARWRASVPDNFFTCDANLRRVLPLYDPGYASYEAELAAFGHAVAAVIDPAATVNDRPHNHPRLDAWDGIGQRTESIEFHPSYHAAGRPVYEAGLLALSAEPGHAVQQSALFYLLTQAGEMGHACPIVCTLGLIRALQVKGSDELKATYLPPLLARDYDRKQTASQFLTEVQGGSDVGANAVEARLAEDQPGAWLLRGEKWFCSVANADQMLVTARPAGAAEGTRGLGTFLVPRRLADGSLNAFHIRRLKTKFGTRTMASGEIDFEDAVAYPIGQIDEGFKIVVELVLNTSRWTNALGSAGLLRRAYVEAWTFAQQRRAFGAAIGRYPLVLEALAEMKSDLYAMLASTLRLSSLVNRIDLGAATEQERAVHRLLVNVNKYITSVQASLGIRRAQEIMGGNGAIEDFSVLPRLYRDALVFESWEGSHNVLCLQVARDMQRYGLHQQLFTYLGALLDGVTRPELAEAQDLILGQMERVQERLGRVLTGSFDFHQTHVRRAIDQLALLVQAVCLLAEADWELSQGLDTDKPAALAFFLNRYLRLGYDAMEDEKYLERLVRVAEHL
ncbi:MAG TPA: acyl-CoA dehydrogenase family protein [Anaerolineae bacterium]|nr:acyl-CoA dehydrogenase family protein [Anaerolineae bacterium]